MYTLAEVEEWVGLLPREDVDVSAAALEYLRSNLEGSLDPELGIIIAVLGAEVISDGVIIPMPGDPRVYYLVRYRVLAFKPVLLEVVRGTVVEAKDIGIFVDLGAIDGFVHKTQIMDEPVEYMPERRGFRGVRSGRIIEVGDIVRARITAIGKDTRPRSLGMRIGMTMRQPYLGKEEWIAEGA